MATTINPAVSGVSYRRWSYHVVVYTAGIAGGALLSYAAAYGLYSLITYALPTWAWLAATSPLLALVVLRDLGARVWIPYPERTQVPEWLRHMLCCSQINTDTLIDIFGMGGHNDNRDVPGLCILAQSAKELISILSWHHDI